MVRLNGRTLGLQAIILCGPGTSLYPFSKSEDVPKALLPIANIPMIYYPLEWCQKASVRSITIVALSEHRAALEAYLNSTKFLNSAASKGLKKLDIPLTLETPSSINDSLGTADLLRILFKKEKINGDFLVLPCDLVVTGVDLNQLISVWMVHQGKYGKDEAKKGGLAVWGRVKVGGGKTTESDLLGVTEPIQPVTHMAKAVGSVHNLAYTIPAHLPAALKSTQDIQLRHSFIRHYGNVTFHSRTHRDSHIYIFPSWVGKVLLLNEKISSLKEDLIPMWAKSIWQKRQVEKLHFDEIFTASEPDLDQPELHASNIDIEAMTSTRSLSTRDIISHHVDLHSTHPTSGTVTPTSDISTSHRLTQKAHRIQPPTITAIVASEDTTAYIERVDTPQIFLSANLLFAQTREDPINPQPHTNPRVPDPRKVDPSCKLEGTITSSDCVVGPDCTLGRQSAVKKSVLGSGVRVAKGAKVLGCVLLDGAVVLDNARIESCIVGKGATIGKNCSLKDCEIADGVVVEEGTDAKGESFVDFDESASGGEYAYDDDDDDEEDGDEWSGEDSE